MHAREQLRERFPELRHRHDIISVARAGSTIKGLFDGKPRIDKYFNVTAVLLQQNA
jgi:hypothetical protein